MPIPIFSGTVLATPTIGSASVNESGELTISLSRGSDEPDFIHYHVYISTTPGVTPSSYEFLIQSVDGNVNDSGPWTPPLYLVPVEVAYDGEESVAGEEYEIEAAPAPGGSTENPGALLILNLISRRRR